MKTRTNRKIRNLNQTGAGDEIIEKNTTTISQEIYAEAANPGKKYNCRIPGVPKGGDLFPSAYLLDKETPITDTR